MKTLLREPLLHFLVIGALLFVLFDVVGGGTGGGTQRIVVGAGQIAQLEAGFTKTWQRAPNEAELKDLVDEWVREEIATREAMALGLERDDTVIRRRLRQKFEFMTEDQLDAAPPSEAELQAFLDTYPDNFRREPRLSFRQVMLDPQRRGAALNEDARELLARLQAAGADADLGALGALGDSRLLPEVLADASLRDVARLFGEAFAGELLKVEPGRWSGPLRSGYGVHLVLVTAREAGGLPALADVRPLVERDFMADRRRRALDARYASMLERYRVVVEPRPTPPGPGVPQ
ncbi:MAG: peptidylprolyl isomerase [Rubrivivax sp.]|nr:peptidylprolyl isomerase [Rubrivivax sp.]